MPNWCSGQLNINGKAENVLNCARHLTYSGPLVESRDYYGNKYIDYGWKNSPRIRETDRCYICSDYSVEFDDEEHATTFVECAWDLDVEGFRKLSEKYHVDLYIEGEEGGMGFAHKIDIKDGKVEVDAVCDITWDEHREEFDYGEWESL